MTALAHQRCAHHPVREAVARCPECQRFYCRECVTEHDDRLLCAECLRRLSARAAGGRRRLTGLVRAAQLLAGILVCWLFFYYSGRILLAIPAAFHEGVFWQGEEPGE